jgi:hypothetical protein
MEYSPELRKEIQEILDSFKNGDRHCERIHQIHYPTPDCTVEEFDRGKDTESLYWTLISNHPKGLSIEFLRTFKDRLNWYSIASNPNLSEEIIKEFNIKKIEFSPEKETEYSKWREEFKLKIWN